MVYSPHMDLFGCSRIASSIFALILTGPILGEAYVPTQNPASQTQSNGSSKPKRHDSVEVVAKLSPEEVEDGKLNDWNGGRGFYYRDNDGHVIELMTAPQ